MKNPCEARKIKASQNLHKIISITEEDIKGEFKHGILKLFVPKKEAKAAVPERKFIAIEG